METYEAFAVWLSYRTWIEIAVMMAPVFAVVQVALFVWLFKPFSRPADHLTGF